MIPGKKCRIPEEKSGKNVLILENSPKTGGEMSPYFGTIL